MSGVGKCEICYDVISTSETTVYCGECNQDYHTDCIEMSLTITKKCPMCKSNFWNKSRLKSIPSANYWSQSRRITNSAGICNLCYHPVRDRPKPEFCSNCNDDFHEPCIQSHLRGSRNCPTCGQQFYWPSTYINVSVNNHNTQRRIDPQQNVQNGLEDSPIFRAMIYASLFSIVLLIIAFL